MKLLKKYVRRQINGKNRKDYQIKKEDYRKMQDMIYGYKPGFEEMIEYIKKLEIKINSLK